AGRVQPVADPALGRLVGARAHAARRGVQRVPCHPALRDADPDRDPAPALHLGRADRRAGRDRARSLLRSLERRLRVDPMSEQAQAAATPFRLETLRKGARGRILSGMRPTGRLHLGNWVGALSNWVKLQDEYENFHMVADWHALTTGYEQ